METYARLTEHCSSPTTPPARGTPTGLFVVRYQHHTTTRALTMIIITKPDITDDELDHLRERIEAAGLHTHLSRGEHRTIIGCIGDESRLHELHCARVPASNP